MSFDLENFFSVLAIVGAVLVILVYWGADFWDWLSLRSLKRRKKVCRLCGMRFYGDGTTSVQECPHCHALNK